AQPLPPTLRTSHSPDPPTPTLPTTHQDRLDAERCRRGHGTPACGALKRTQLRVEPTGVGPSIRPICGLFVVSWGPWSDIFAARRELRVTMDYTTALRGRHDQYLFRYADLRKRGLKGRRSGPFGHTFGVAAQRLLYQGSVQATRMPSWF